MMPSYALGRSRIWTPLFLPTRHCRGLTDQGAAFRAFPTVIVRLSTCPVKATTLHRVQSLGPDTPHPEPLTPSDDHTSFVKPPAYGATPLSRDVLAIGRGLPEVRDVQISSLTIITDILLFVTGVMLTFIFHERANTNGLNGTPWVDHFSLEHRDAQTWTDPNCVERQT